MPLKHPQDRDADTLEGVARAEVAEAMDIDKVEVQADLVLLQRRTLMDSRPIGHSLGL